VTNAFREVRSFQTVLLVLRHAAQLKSWVESLTRSAPGLTPNSGITHSLHVWSRLLVSCLSLWYTSNTASHTKILWPIAISDQSTSRSASVSDGRVIFPLLQPIYTSPSYSDRAYRHNQHSRLGHLPQFASLTWTIVGSCLLPSLNSSKVNLASLFKSMILKILSTR
jgi:hypothetical protein